MPRAMRVEQSLAPCQTQSSALVFTKCEATRAPATGADGAATQCCSGNLPYEVCFHEEQVRQRVIQRVRKYHITADVQLDGKPQILQSARCVDRAYRAHKTI